jgi:hypothetical protein
LNGVANAVPQPLSRSAISPPWKSP